MPVKTPAKTPPKSPEDTQPGPFTKVAELMGIIEREGQDSVYVQACRDREGEVEPEHLHDYPAREFNIDRVRRDFGPGRYTFSVLTVSGYQYRGRRTIPIGPAPLSATPAPASSPTPAAPAAPVATAAPAADDRFERLLTSMLTQAQNQNAELMKALANRAPAPAAGSDTATVIGLAKDLAALAGGGKDKSPLSMLRELAEVKELLAGLGDGGGGSTNKGDEGTLMEIVKLGLAAYADGGTPSPEPNTPIRERPAPEHQAQGVSPPGAPGGSGTQTATPPTPAAPPLKLANDGTESVGNEVHAREPIFAHTARVVIGQMILSSLAQGGSVEEYFEALADQIDAAGEAVAEKFKTEPEGRVAADFVRSVPALAKFREQLVELERGIRATLSDPERYEHEEPAKS